jgi:hypothetical protein
MREITSWICITIGRAQIRAHMKGVFDATDGERKCPAAWDREYLRFMQ